MRTYPDILEWSVRKVSLSPPARARARGPGGGGRPLLQTTPEFLEWSVRKRAVTPRHTSAHKCVDLMRTRVALKKSTPPWFLCLRCQTRQKHNAVRKKTEASYSQEKKSYSTMVFVLALPEPDRSTEASYCLQRRHYV